MGVRSLFVAGMAAVVLAAPAWAAEGEEAGTLSISFENDAFGLGGTDRNYSHGTRIEWLSPPRPELPIWARVLGRIPLLDPAGEKRIGYALGQNMYTPETLDTGRPLPNERPYAGWLYAGLSLSSATDETLDTIELDLGIIGPWSLAEDVQRTWHRWFEFQKPRGWDNQLENEPGIMLIYERRWRFDASEGPRGFQLQLMPNVGGAVGNVMVYGSAGVQLRVGYDLPRDFGPARINPSLPGSAFYDPVGGFGWYLFAGVGGRVVPHNIFLDGNTFEDSLSVERELFVGDVQFGAAIAFEPFRITYTHVFRTPEFEEQQHGDNFGSINVSVRF